jgi:DNA mismatch repair protein MutL
MTANRIRILDRETVHRIAAGEVVEGPASVVKELVENAIDAGAGRISVAIRSEGSGITSIRVTDDGCGMDPDDAPLAFAAHATSKIRSIEDIARCTSMGFRGEALASISAVARVTLLTKPAGTLTGTRVRAEGGGSPAAEEAGSPDGTSVLVEDLFYNTPARRRFQKSTRSELVRITGLLERSALAYPSIAFTLSHNGRGQIATPGSGDLPGVIAILFGPELPGQLVRLDAKHPLGSFGGYLSRPAIARSNPYQVMISVNRRQVSWPAAVRAVREGYGTLLPKDRFPVAFLELTLPPAQVDPNVHPAKRVVRVAREPEVLAALTAAVASALAESDLVPPVRAGPQVPKRPIPGAVFGYKEPFTAPAGIREAAPRLYADTDRRLRQSELPSGVTGPAENLPLLPVLGQLGESYILTAAPDGALVVIDQHAAHERVLYEQLGGGPVRAQELIEPLLLEFSPQETAALKVLIPDLSAEGFLVEEFGHGVFAVRQVPVVLGRSEDPAAVREVIAEMLGGGPAPPVPLRERIRRSVACHAAIKANTSCSAEQCERLVAQLARTGQPFTCPHGRPTMISFSRTELEKMFHRK